MNEEDMRPCPFCGRSVELRLAPMFGSDDMTEYYSIHCECDLGSPDALFEKDQKPNLIDSWNKRYL